jgi:hypothetical protein
MAMLTNPYETQVVASLGVTIGPQGSAGATAGANPGATLAGAGAAAASAAAGDPGREAAALGGLSPEAAQEGGGKCPFAGMIPGLTGRDTAAGTGADGHAGAAAPVEGVIAPAPAWTDAASARLAAIPSFVRPMARTGIERFARERGYATIDERVLDEARAFFGM